MSAIKRMMEDKSELALMGKFVPVENEDEVRFITNYILTVLNKDDLFSDVDIYKDHLHKYGNSNKVTHIGTNRVMDMPCITFCLENEEVPKLFEEDYGTGNPCAFCYILNLDAPDMCSEFGDCFFKKGADNYYHRVS